MTRCLMVLCAVGLLLGGVASASVRQGDTELNLMGGILSENSTGGAASHPGVDFKAWFLSTSFGYFLTDNLEVGACGFGMQSTTTLDNAASPDQDIDLDAYGIGVQAKWYFMPSNLWVPYVGGQLLWTKLNIDASDVSGTAFLDNDYEGFMWGPVAGLRFELNSTNDFFVEYQYQVWENELGKYIDDGNGLFVGIIHQFK